MPTKKSSPKKAVQKKSIMAKIGGQVGHLAGEIVLAKENLVQKAGDAIDSVKETIQTITTKKKTAPKKAAKAVKKSIKKTAKPVIKKVKKAAAKKVAPAKKAVNKVAKKVIGKKK